MFNSYFARAIAVPIVCILALAAPLSAQVNENKVRGNLIQFTDNGAWSWFQDERVVVDVANNQIILGAIANGAGFGGTAVDGDVRAIQFDLSSGSRKTTVLGNLKSYGGGDDHNVPAFQIKQDGNILAFYAGHNNLNGNEDGRSFFRTLDTTSNTWSNQREFSWWNSIPSNTPGAGGTTYSNLFQLAKEDPDGDGNGRLYNIARMHQSPHIMYSDNNGVDWVYGGQLTKQPSGAPTHSYVNGYYKYSSNGQDRIDIIATEFHPRDYNTSIYHAYIKNGKLLNSANEVIDHDIFDVAASFDASKITSTDDFTKVFQAGATENSRAWISDVQVYEDGSIRVLFKARDGAYSANHDMGSENQNVWLARFDPSSSSWSTYKIARAGGELFTAGAESDYTGLGALDPSDPNTVYISTEINPITGVATAQHEIYKGATSSNGASFAWSAITENSTFDNLRPIVAKWDANNTALLWWRGEMTSSQRFDTAVVGLIIRERELTSPIEYVDASLANTKRVDGRSLNITILTGPEEANGSWYVQQGFGNCDNVFASGGTGPEDTPTLSTVVTELEEGIYDAFVFFWAGNDEDWQIRAGLSEDMLTTFRRFGAQGIDPEQFPRDFVSVENNSDLQLYRAYLGRQPISEGESLKFFVGGSMHTANRLIPTWFDGVGYSRVVDVPEPSF